MLSFSYLRIAIFISGLALSFYSVTLVGLDFYARPVLTIGEKLEGGITPHAETVDLLSNLRDANALSCRRDIQRATLNVNMAVLENRLEDPAAADTLDRARDKIMADLKGHLGCFPLDGNAWLRLAMVAVRFEGPGPQVVDYVRLSQWLAPYEAWILSVRLPFLVALERTGDATVEQLVEDDTRTLLRYAPVFTVRQVYERLGARGRDRLRAAASELDKERTDLLSDILELEEQ